MSQSRQLAAIMFTDIVGYTALMGKDEQKAMQLLDQNRVLQKPLIEEYRGKYLKEMGDGILASFNSAGDAISCALSIQKALSDDQELTLRIGIHLGDITFKDDDVFGDGVNIASRIQSIADPGGIYISESIHKAIRGRSDIQAQYLGETQLKNVDYPVKIYALQGVGLPVPDVKEDKELSGHLWAEVQRRGIIRAAISYMVVALLLVLLWDKIQDLGIALPGWSFTLLMVTLGVGFPFALYLAWIYERSPEGFVRTSSQQSWQNPLKAGQRKPLTSNFIIAGMALIIVVMYAYPRFLANSGVNDEVIIADKSIAVLPFKNMSGDPEQEALCDGLTEEIIHHLSQIKSFDKVISRSSVMSFKNSDKTLPEIAGLLKVNIVLEGSFRQSGDQIKITAQLIDAVNDNHLWSEIYERPFGDIFDIQSDIAKNIAAKFKAEITLEEEIRLDKQQTESSEAYILLKKGWYKSLNYDDQGAIDFMKKALEIDPGYAEAYSGLAYLYLFSDVSFRGDKSISLENPMPLVQKALDLDPELGHAYMTLGAILFWKEWNFVDAEKAYKKAVELDSKKPFILTLYAGFLIKMGRAKEAVPYREKAVVLDPTSPLELSSLAEAYLFSGNYEKATETLMEFESLFPNQYSGVVGQKYLYLDNLGKAIEILESSLERSSVIPRFISCRAIAYSRNGQDQKALDLLDQLKQMSQEKEAGSPEYFTALFYSGTGQKEEALLWLEKAYDSHDTELTWLKVDPMFKPLHDDPRYQDLLKRVGFPE